MAEVNLILVGVNHKTTPVELKYQKLSKVSLNENLIPLK